MKNKKPVDQTAAPVAPEEAVALTPEQEVAKLVAAQGLNAASLVALGKFTSGAPDAEAYGLALSAKLEAKVAKVAARKAA